LRHFYASVLFAEGLNPKEVCTAMGHSLVRITFDVYGHLFEEDRRGRRAKITRIAQRLFD